MLRAHMSSSNHRADVVQLALLYTCRVAAFFAPRSSLFHVMLLYRAGARQSMTRICAQFQQQGVRGICCLLVRAVGCLAAVYPILC